MSISITINFLHAEELKASRLPEELVDVHIPPKKPPILDRNAVKVGTMTFSSLGAASQWMRNNGQHDPSQI